MDIAGTVTYGNYFTMLESGPYRIGFTVKATRTAGPVVVEFAYEHPTQ
jgi:hypothetical protein